MTNVRQSTFIITRDDRSVDPKTILSEGVRIGRLPDSDVWLNHPAVSRLHAGISEIEGYFYLINLSASSPTKVNGRVIPFNESAALATCDVIQIGPFSLTIEDIEAKKEIVSISVKLEFATNAGERVSRHTGELYQKQLELDRPTKSSSDATDALKIFWNKRTREKAGRPSPLHPQKPPRLGKAQFNWRPTRDLVRPWPFAIFIWALIVVGSFSVVAAFTYKIAFAPERISDPHTRTAFTLTPAIAKEPSGSSCTSCHAIGVSVANKEKMNANCAACHQTEAFAATIIPAHREAGITCTTCHTEHRGENFRPMNFALESCTKCHTDDNKHLYNGKSVHTPHGGTYGYPVVNGVWIWKGLDEEELKAKPELAALLKKSRADQNNPQQWRNAQFHAIHVERVRVTPGVTGVEDVDAVNQMMSCSSCHKTGYMGAIVDRAYPRTTCARCHNAQVFEGAKATTRSETPSCTSCHVQHIKDVHWAPSLRIAQAGALKASDTK
ncbi:MAG: FHA domain-containing protein [Pyrinomonadaceae bacterium]